MVGGTGIEPVTPCVSSKCSTAELTAHTLRFHSLFHFVIRRVRIFKYAVLFMPCKKGKQTANMR